MEIFSIISILILTTVLFFIVRTMEMIDNYSHMGMVVKSPLKCKKCHIKFTILKSCKHGKHHISTPFIASIFLLAISFGGIAFAEWSFDQPSFYIPDIYENMTHAEYTQYHKNLKEQ